jgi:predicted DNA-binding ribbon-helix-helix protein
MAKHAIKTRGVVINGRRTSLRLEPEYWGFLKDIAAYWTMSKGRKTTTQSLLESCHYYAMQEHRGFSSMIRLLVARYYKDRFEEMRTKAQGKPLSRSSVYQPAKPKPQQERSKTA